MLLPFSFGSLLQFIFLMLWSILLLHFIAVFWLTPQMLHRKLVAQGIRGPKPSFIMGNIPEMKRLNKAVSQTVSHTLNKVPGHSCYTDISRIYPHFRHWTSTYGLTFVFALGTRHFIYTADTKLVKELHQCRDLNFGKPTYLQEDRGPLLGKGLITTSGPVWLHQRKTVAPELYTDKIKGMLSIMIESGKQFVELWEHKVEKGGGCTEIKIDNDIRSFTSNVISKAMFGSKNYAVGKKLFPQCRALMKALESLTLLDGLPFLRYLPTKKNKMVWEREKQICSLVLDIASRERGHQDDEFTSMVQVLVEGAKNVGHGPCSKKEFIVDNCKELYLTAFEVPAVAVIWCLMLLAAYPEWQARVRKEIEEICGGSLLDIDMLNKMKVTRMVILEVLRLYPIVAYVSRQAKQDVQLPSILVPKGVNIWLWLPAIHRDIELWGSDANEFNPERFANGVAGACKSPHSFIPFGVGIRSCPGQYFAVLEMKVLFAFMLSNFSMTVSPNYCHSPLLGMLLEPEHGVKLLVQKI